MGAAYRIYTQISPSYNASIYYRILLPIGLMEEMGLPVEGVIDLGEAMVSNNDRIGMFMESDMNIMYQSSSDFRLHMMSEAKKFKPLRDAGAGCLRWPPSFIVDTDDDLFNVMPLNATYGINGIRRPDGTDAAAGDEIGVAHPLEIAPLETEAMLLAKHNKPIPGARADLGKDRYIYGADGRWHTYLSLWQDGKNINFEANRKHIDIWRKTVQAANLVTCSTPGAEAYIKKECGADIPTYVSYNAINFAEYPDVELREHPGEVRILWQGSVTHHEDLWPLNDSIARVAEKYPQTSWWFWGAPYKWAVKSIPADRLKLVPWVHFETYKTRLSTINHDINLAPLAPHLFNKSRSAIKWYESSAICKPAATLAQNTGSYGDEIQDGETGLLFSTPAEFEEKLGMLIEQESLRKTLASNAKDWVRTNREARQIINKLFQKWVEVREGHKLTMPAEDVLAGVA